MTVRIRSKVEKVLRRKPRPVPVPPVVPTCADCTSPTYVTTRGQVCQRCRPCQLKRTRERFLADKRRVYVRATDRRERLDTLQTEAHFLRERRLRAAHRWGA